MKRVQREPCSSSAEDNLQDNTKRVRLQTDPFAALEAAFMGLSCLDPSANQAPASTPQPPLWASARPSPTAAAASQAAVPIAAAAVHSWLAAGSAMAQPLPHSMSIRELLDCMVQGGPAAEAAATRLGNLTAPTGSSSSSSSSSASSSITDLLQYDGSIEALLGCMASSSYVIIEQATRVLSHIAAVPEAHPALALAGAAAVLVDQSRNSTHIGAQVAHAACGVARMCSTAEGAAAVAGQQGSMYGIFNCMLHFDSDSVPALHAVEALRCLTQRNLGTVLQHPDTVSNLVLCLERESFCIVAEAAHCFQGLAKTDAGIDAILNSDGAAIKALVVCLGHASGTVVCNALSALTSMVSNDEYGEDVLDALEEAGAIATAVAMLGHSNNDVLSHSMKFLAAVALYDVDAGSPLLQAPVVEQLVARVTSMDSQVAEAAADLVRQLARHNGGAAALLEHGPVVEMMVHALQRTPTVVASQAATVLRNLAQHSDGAAAVLAEPGAVLALVSALEHVDANVTKWAASALGQLALSSAAAANAVTAAGAIPALVHCLRSGNATTAKSVDKALQQITAGDAGRFSMLMAIMSKKCAEHHDMRSLAAVAERLEASERNLQEALVRAARHVPGTTVR